MSQRFSTFFVTVAIYVEIGGIPLGLMLGHGRQSRPPLDVDERP
jgi:hypothetical protein